ncbi:hypothetical protein DFQ27_009335, partial [Actinomortierella ambigua]
QEQQQQDFNELRFRRYGMKGHVAQPTPALAQVVTNATPDDVEFRCFTPYPFLNPVSKDDYVVGRSARSEIQMAVIKEAKVVTAHTIRRTVKKVIAASGKKRKAKNNSVNGSNDKDSDTVGEEKDQEGDDSADGPAEIEDEKDEPGTTGDHNGFCTSLLRYHRRPTATLRTGKRFTRLIQSARGN